MKGKTSGAMMAIIGLLAIGVTIFGLSAAGVFKGNQAQSITYVNTGGTGSGDTGTDQTDALILVAGCNLPSTPRQC